MTSRATQWKVTIILVIIVASVWFLIPSFRWYSSSAEEQNKLQRLRDPIAEKRLKLGLDLQGGIHLLLEAEIDKMPEGIELTEAMNRALEVIRNRVDQFGVAEPLIAKQGDRWIVVQYPGLSEPQRALDLIGKTALLEFRLVNEAPIPSDIADLPEGTELLQDRQGNRLLINKEASLTGASLKTANVRRGGEFNRPQIGFTLESDAADVFSNLTANNVGRRLAIVLDDVVQSAPEIMGRIPHGEGVIQGNFTMESAKDLAIILRSGALPVPVKIIENRIIGPSLGSDSIRSGVTALGIGFLLVLVFMIIYYRSAGLIADTALILNILILLGVMAYFRFTLTLPGIAGIILTVGMAVDANVLIFERIREELDLGKTPRVAIDAGYAKALTTILDANITTLIAAFFLFQLGTGSVQGFAVTLFIGIIVSIFTAVVVTKTIFELMIQDRQIKELKI